MLRVREGGFGRLAVAALPVEAEIVRDVVPNQRRTGLGGARRVRDGRQNVIVNLDQFGGVLGGRGVFRDDKGDAIADMPRAPTREQRVLDHFDATAVAVLQRHDTGNLTDAVALEVRTGEDANNAGCGECRRRIDRTDDRVRMRRAQDIADGLARQYDVICIVAGTGDEAAILAAPHRLANAELSHGGEISVVVVKGAKIAAQARADQSLFRPDGMNERGPCACADVTNWPRLPRYYATFSASSNARTCRRAITS